MKAPDFWKLPNNICTWKPKELKWWPLGLPLQAPLQGAVGLLEVGLGLIPSSFYRFWTIMFHTPDLKKQPNSSYNQL